MADAGGSALDPIRGIRTVAAALLALLAVFAAAPSAHALTRAQAADKALDELGSQRGSDAVTVFGLRSALRPRTVIGQAGPGSAAVRARAGRTAFERKRNRRIVRAGATMRRADVVMRSGSERTWMFFEDRGPHQAFEHTGRVVLVGVRTGRVRVSGPTRWVPLIDGKLPPFFRSAKGYESKRYRVFHRMWAAPGARSRARTRQAPDAEPRQRVADALAAERSCALRISDTLGDFFDFGRVDQTRARLGLLFEGLETLNRGFISRRYTTKAAQSPIQVAQDLIDDEGCRDLFLYVAGAGARTGDGRIVIGMRPARGGMLEWHELAVEDLERLVRSNRGVTFKFLFDAPYTARLNERLIDEANTVLLIASGGPNEASFTFLPEILGPDGVVSPSTNPDQLLEFTNAILAGLEAFVADPRELDAWLAGRALGGPSMMAWMMARAMALSPAWMFAAPIDTLKLPVMPAPGDDTPRLGAPSPVNHAPVPTTPAQPTQEDTAKAFTLTANDPDGDPLTFSVTDPPDHGTLTGTAPNLVYTPAQDFHGNDAFTYQVSDDRGANATQVVQLPVSPDNDAAAVAAGSSGSNAAFVEDGAAVVVDGGLTIADPDSTQLESAQVRILGGFEAGEDELVFADQLGITGDYDADDGILALSGAASVSDYQTALRSVEFDSTSQNPVANRTVEFRAEDGDEAGVPATRVVEVEAINDAPALTVPGAQSTGEDAALSFAPLTSNAISVADADADAGSGAVDVDLSVADGALTLGDTSGLASSTGDGTGTLSLSGTVSAVNAALSGLSYAPDANFNGADSLSVMVDDQGHNGTGGALSDTESVAISVSAVNDAPVNTVPGAQSVAEDGTLTLTSALSVADVDAGAGAIRATLSVADGTLDVASTGGTVTGDGSDTVQVDGTVSQVNAALAGVDYAPSANFNGGDSLQLVTSDLGNSGSGGTQTDTDSVAITVTAVNDAPQLSVPGAQTVDEDADETFANSSLISVSDADAGSDAIRVVLAAADGALTLSSTSGLTFTDGTSNGTGSLKFEGALAAVNAALSGMTYRGDQDFNGSDALSIDVSDLGRTGSGGAQTDSDSVAITVSAVNDAPVNTVPGAQSVAEDGTLTLSSALSVADVDAGAGAIRTTLSVADGTLDVDSTGGTLTGDGTDTVQIEGTVAQVDAALASVDYAPDADFNGGDSLEVATTDLGNSGSGGTQTDTDTVAITVSAVNDAPVNVLPATAVLDEDTSFAFAAADAAGVSDLDAGPADELEVTLDVDHGTLDLDGTTGLDFTAGDGTGDATMTFRGTEAELADALDGMSYDPAADYAGADTLTMTTSDLGSTGSGGAQTDTDTAAITVTAVNDAPVNTVPGAQSAVENTLLTLGTVSVADVDTASLEVTLDVDHGTLKLPTTTDLAFTTGDGDGDATMVFSGTQSALNAALDGIAYTPTTGYTGADTLTVTSDDGALSDTDTVAIDVDALNIAPVNTVPGGQSVDEDATKTFSAGNGNAISIGDADAGTDDVEVTLSVDEGVLSLGGTTGLTFGAGDGDGTGDETMTFTGTIAAVNAALAGMTYTGAQDFNGADVLTVTTDDLGHNGAGGAQSDTDTVAITVDAVNDAPVVSLPAAQSVAEDGTLTLSTANLNRISASDVDHGGGDASMSLTVTDGTLTLPSTTGLAFTTGDGAGDGTMAFTGTRAAINAALDGLQFTPNADYNGGSTLTVLTSDQGHTGSGGALTDSEDLAITVSAVNDAPVLTVPSSPHAVTENDTTQLTLSVADVDAASDDVEVALGVDHGSLTLGTTSGLTFTSGADGSGAMTFEGTLAEVNAAMTNLTYEPAADYFGADTLSASVDDKGRNGSGGAQTDSDSVTLDVQAANSAPVNSVPGTQTFDEDTNRTFSSAGSNAISVSDPDAGGDDVETTLTATNGTLTVGSSAGLTSITGDGTGTVTLTGTAAEITSALDGLVYAPAADFSGSPTITVETDDLGHNGGGGAKTDTDVVNLTVAAVNDAPSLTLADATVDVDENSSLTFSNANSNGLSVADVDAGAGGVKMTLGVDHGTLTLGGTSGITFVDSTSDGSGSLKFTGTVADVNAALNGLVYEPDANYDVDDTLSAIVDDQGNTGGGSLTDSDSVAIEINPSNSPPEHTVPGTQTFDEDTTLAFSTGNGNAISVSDSDAGGADVRTTLSVTNGTLSIDTTGLDFSCGACAGSGTADATMTFEGTVAEIDAALQTLTYAPAADDTGTETLTITTDDLGNTGPPGPQSDTDNVTLSITAVNDAPVNTVPGAQSVDEDTNLVFSSGNGNAVSIADVDAGSNDVRVTLASTHGVLTLGGTTGLSFTAGDGTSDAAMTFDGTVAEVNTALSGLTFRGSQDYFGSAGLSIATSDQSHSGSGGALSDSDNVSITVNPVNDAPVADDESFSGNDSAHGNTTMQVDDPDDDKSAPTQPHTEVTGDILAGDTDVDGPTPLTATPGTFATSDGGSVEIESDGDFRFHPAATTSCTDTSDFFDYTVEDNSPLGEQTDTGRVTIAIAGCVWYVSNTAAANGGGTSAAPYDTLAEAEAASGANHTVFVFDGDNTSTGLDAGGYQMNSGERLIGEHEGLTVDPDQGGGLTADTLRAANAGAHPTVVANGADVIALDDGNEIRGFTIDPAGTGAGIAGASGDTGGATIDDVNIVDNGTAGTDPGLELVSATGTFNVSNFVVSNKATGVLLTSAGTVNFAGDTSQVSISSNGGPGLSAFGTNMGTSQFDDITVTNSTGGGVSLTNLTGSTTLGDGTGTDLSLTTTSGAAAGLFAANVTGLNVASAGTDNISATGGPAVDVNGSSGTLLELDDVDSTSSANDGVNLDGLGSGTFSANASSTIAGASGIGFDVNAGTGDVTFAGAINNGEGSAADVTGRTGGTVLLSGPINESGDSDAVAGEAGGITLSGNSGGATTVNHATKTFSTGEDNAITMATSDGHTLTLSGGTLDIDTTSGKGLEATASGTLNVTGTANTIDTTTGRALNVSSTDVGGTPLTFQRISANGAASGILLDSTGSNSALTVTSSGGTCTAANQSGCTGGRIQNTTGADTDTNPTPTGTGIVLNNTRGISLTRMHLNDHANYGIRGSNVNGFTFANSVVNGTNGTNANGDFNESSILFDSTSAGGAGLIGSASFTNSHIQGGHANNVWIKNESGALNRATFDAVTIGTTNGDGIMVEGLGSSTSNVTVQNSSFTAAAGDLFQMIGSGSGGSDLDFTSNAMSNSHPSIATGGGGVTITGGAGTGGHFDVDITGTNTFRDSHTHALTLQKSAGAGSMNATVSGAQIGLAGTANSGSLEGSGIAFHVQSNGVNPVNATATIANNQIRQYNNYGIDLQAGTGVGGSGNVNLTVTGNTIANPGNNAAIGNIFQGIHLNSGVVSSDSYLTCALISGNTASNSGRNGGHDIRVRARQSTTVRLPGYSGGATDTSAVASYLLGQNTAVTASASAPDATSGGYVGGAACPQ